MGRRANGEGSVYQRKAIQAARRTHQLKDEGALQSNDQTLEAFLTAWLQDTAQPRLRPRTYLRYRELLTLHVLPTLGKTKLQKLSPPQLQKLYREKLAAGYAPQTVKHIHRVLHKALHDAMRWQLIARNVCDAVDAPRVPRKEMHALTLEEARTFLACIKGDPLEALYILALTTGMRRGELLALKWEDIDMAHSTLQVRRTIARIPNQGFQVSEPKTAKSRRSIQVAAVALDALKQHRIRQQEQRLAAGASWADEHWVFCNAEGKPLDPSSMLRYSFYKLLAKAELPKIRFHDVRRFGDCKIALKGQKVRAITF